MTISIFEIFKKNYKKSVDYSFFFFFLVVDNDKAIEFIYFFFFNDKFQI